MVQILTNGDPIGSVTVLPTESHALTEAEVKTAELGAKLLACQIGKLKKSVRTWLRECPATLRDALCFLLIP